MNLFSDLQLNESAPEMEVVGTWLYSCLARRIGVVWVLFLTSTVNAVCRTEHLQLWSLTLTLDDIVRIKLNYRASSWCLESWGKIHLISEVQSETRSHCNLCLGSQETAVQFLKAAPIFTAQVSMSLFMATFATSFLSVVDFSCIFHG